MGNQFEVEQSSDITLRQVFQLIWKDKVMVAITTLIFAIASVVFALSLPNIYRAEVLLAPVEDGNNSGLGNIAGQLGGLASLAGFDLGGQQTNRTAIALETLKSRFFITQFVEEHEFLPEIMAVEEWSRAEGLKYDLNIYNPEAKKWVREVSPPKSVKPSAWEFVKIFKEDLLEVTNDEKTGLVTVAIKHQSPDIAKLMVELLVKDLNDAMRERDIAEAKRSLTYLKEELTQTNVSNLQQVFYQLIERQTQTMMLANVRPEYVFQTLDPAVIPEQHFKPSRSLICIVITLFGGLIAVSVSIGRRVIFGIK